MASKIHNRPTLIDLIRLLPALVRPVASVISKLFAIGEVNRIYADVHSQLNDFENDPNFFKKTLEVMGVHFELDAESYSEIPKTGRLIVVSNHPFGGLDGVVLGALLKGLRLDSKLMGNYLLAQMEGIRGSIIQVDPFENEASAKSNLDGMRQALKHLKSDGCLGVFPAGEVSSYDLRNKLVTDKRWSTHVVKLALKTNTPILPIFFEGQNSWFFQLAGLMHPKFRTALLAREFCRKQHHELFLNVGKLIKPSQLARFETQDAASDYLRLKTYALKNIQTKLNHFKTLRFPFRSSAIVQNFKPLAPPQLKERMRKEIEALSHKSELVRHNNFVVYAAKAKKIPTILKEIGRLREETFRAAQEGTGKASDLDLFDAYYIHLFVWDVEADAIVGAYRMGLIDQILKKRGKKGLYTNTLFKFRSGFLKNLGPAIELGRSFVSLKYQKKHSSLALLLKGISHYCIQNPQYKLLFGPVSITDAYRNISKELMVHFFKGHNFDEALSPFVSAKKPPKTKEIVSGVSLKKIAKSINSVDAVSAIISEMEDDDKGIPVLLKHYLKLNGSLLSFNVDPAFSDVIDGLIIVDLTKSDKKLLQKHMGKEGYGKFMRYHDSEYTD